MTAMTNFLEDRIYNYLFRNTAPGAVSATWIALYTVAPGEAGGGTEVTGGSYARVQVTQDAAGWTLSSGTTTVNANDITFPTASADWGIVVACAICDASTAGNILLYGNLSASKTVASGDIAKFLAGQLQVQIDN